MHLKKNYNHLGAFICETVCGEVFSRLWDSTYWIEFNAFSGEINANIRMKTVSPYYHGPVIKLTNYGINHSKTTNNYYQTVTFLNKYWHVIKLQIQ